MCEVLIFIKNNKETEKITLYWGGGGIVSDLGGGVYPAPKGGVKI